MVLPKAVTRTVSACGTSGAAGCSAEYAPNVLASAGGTAGFDAVPACAGAAGTADAGAGTGGGAADGVEAAGTAGADGAVEAAGATVEGFGGAGAGAVGRPASRS